MAVMLVITSGCSDDKLKNAPNITAKDSLPFMQAKGVSSLISDSGVLRYKIIAEEWNIHSTSKPQKWTFLKGIYLEKFDSTYHVEWFLQSDTAYCHNQRLWELRGRVTMRNEKDELFQSEELFWDMVDHEVYSNLYMKITTPDKEIGGYHFRSNEQMTKYSIHNSSGEFPFKDSDAPNDSIASAGTLQKQ